VGRAPLRPRGRAVQVGPIKPVQVGPIKPTFKAPGTQHSKLKHDETLPNFAFDSNLRRCAAEVPAGLAAFEVTAAALLRLPVVAGLRAGAYARPLSVPRIYEISSRRLPLCDRVGNSRRDRAHSTCPYESFRTSNSCWDRHWQTS